jgi:hypothetical protein
MYQLLSVKYVFTDWTQLEIPSQVLGSTQLGGTTALLHAISDPMPRAWMTYQTKTTADSGQALAWMADANFDPRKTVILNSELQLRLPASAPNHWLVKIEQYEPEHIVMDAQTPENGVLVVSELAYPGWQAKVNGTAQPVLTADGGLRALTLPAGDSIIEFDFHPVTFVIGLAASILSILSLAAVIVLGSLQARRRKATLNG